MTSFTLYTLKKLIGIYCYFILQIAIVTNKNNKNTNTANKTFLSYPCSFLLCLERNSFFFFGKKFLILTHHWPSHSLSLEKQEK